MRSSALSYGCACKYFGKNQMLHHCASLSSHLQTSAENQVVTSRVAGIWTIYVFHFSSAEVPISNCLCYCLIFYSWRCWRVPCDIAHCLAVYIAGINEQTCLLLVLKFTQCIKHGCPVTLQYFHLIGITILNILPAPQPVPLRIRCLWHKNMLYLPKIISRVKNKKWGLHTLDKFMRKEAL